MVIANARRASAHAEAIVGSLSTHKSSERATMSWCLAPRSSTAAFAGRPSLCVQTVHGPLPAHTAPMVSSQNSRNRKGMDRQSAVRRIWLAQGNLQCHLRRGRQVVRIWAKLAPPSQMQLLSPTRMMALPRSTPSWSPTTAWMRAPSLPRRAMR